MNKQALRLIECGLHPVLLGRAGSDLKRPVQKQWPVREVTVAEAARWPAGNNTGIRCGLQRHGLALTVFDFDFEADRIFPAWLAAVEKYLRARPVIVSSGRGYHAYIYTRREQPGRTLAAKYVFANGRNRRKKLIETLGSGRQVVSAGSRHPSGRCYRLLHGADYGDIPLLSAAQHQTLIGFAKQFDERLKLPARPVTGATQPLTSTPAGVHNCLDYARQHIGAPEQVERNGDIRFLGQGGLLVTADGRGWYAFSDETGGGLAELIVWHRVEQKVAICA